MDYKNNELYTKAKLSCVYGVDKNNIEQLKAFEEIALSFKMQYDSFKYKNIFIEQYINISSDVSSQIEGTQISEEELANIDILAKNKLKDNTTEILNARSVAHELYNNRHNPITIELLCDLQNKLLNNLSSNKVGLKTKNNWIGSSDTNINSALKNDNVILIPIVVEDMKVYLEVFCDFYNNGTNIINNAIQHFQFESIHPFRDGNGRIGRMLIGNYFAHNYGFVLYIDKAISIYGKANYINALNNAQLTGDVIPFINYFVDICIKQIEINKNLMTEIESKIDSIDLTTSTIPVIKHQQIKENLVSNKLIKKTSFAVDLKVNERTAQRYIEELIKLGYLVPHYYELSDQKSKWYKLNI